MKTSAASKSVNEMSETTESTSVSLQIHHMNPPLLLLKHRPAFQCFLFQTQTCCEGLQQLGCHYPPPRLFSVFIFKNRWLKVVWGFSTVVRRCQICLLTSFVFIFPKKSCTDQHFTRHRSTALSLDKTNPQNCRHFFFLCLFQETMKKNVDLFRRLAIFQIVLFVFEKF